MRGTFDVNESAWPIGYLRSNNLYGSGNPGPLYKLTDMRTLEPVLLDDFTIEQVTYLARVVNAGIRNGSELSPTDLASLAKSDVVEK
jgi:hypothetical protein